MDCLDSIKFDEVRFKKILVFKTRKGADYGFAQSDKGEKKYQGF